MLASWEPRLTLIAEHSMIHIVLHEKNLMQAREQATKGFCIPDVHSFSYLLSTRREFSSRNTLLQSRTFVHRASGAVA